MLSNDIKQILEKDTVPAMKEAIMKLADEIEELQGNDGGSNFEEESLKSEVNNLSEKVNDLDTDVGNLNSRVGHLG